MPCPAQTAPRLRARRGVGHRQPPYWYYSATRELRGSLLRESRHPFRVIRRITQFALVVALDVELLFERPSPTFVERLLGACQPSSRCRSKLCRESVHYCGQLRVLHATPDQAPLSGLFRGQLVA